jgi:hypothetical protein
MRNDENIPIPPFEKSLCPISILALTNEVDDIVVEGSVIEFAISFGPFVLVADGKACLVVYETNQSVMLSTSINIKLA